MPRFLIKVAKDRDAYIEWSTIVEAPAAIGNRADFLAGNDEERLARTDAQGTSAMYFDWLPPEKQEGGWDCSGLIYMQLGFLSRARFADVYDLLSVDINASIPAEWLEPFDD